MIIRYGWRTVRREQHRNYATLWRGWFLFGIVPLYVVCLRREYPDVR